MIEQQRRDHLALTEQQALVEQQRQEIQELRQQVARPPKRRYSCRRLMIPALSGLAALTMSGSTYASIPDSGGVIHGCYYCSDDRPGDGGRHR